MNTIAKLTHDTAIRRGKFILTDDKSQMHRESHDCILDELREFSFASEVIKSKHLPGYTEAQEELADILICCLTELHRRGVNIEELVKAKVEFNKTRV